MWNDEDTGKERDKEDYVETNDASTLYLLYLQYRIYVPLSTRPIIVVVEGEEVVPLTE
jgi:hypothetical protein